MLIRKLWSVHLGLSGIVGIARIQRYAHVRRPPWSQVSGPERRESSTERATLQPWTDGSAIRPRPHRHVTTVWPCRPSASARRPLGSQRAHLTLTSWQYLEVWSVAAATAWWADGGRTRYRSRSGMNQARTERHCSRGPTVRRSGPHSRGHATSARVNLPSASGRHRSTLEGPLARQTRVEMIRLKPDGAMRAGPIRAHRRRRPVILRTRSSPGALR
jgi:hypothetical protein